MTSPWRLKPMLRTDNAKANHRPYVPKPKPAPPPKPPYVRAEKRHDIGDGRSLTVKQIMAITGCTRKTVCKRILAGKTKAELLAPVGPYNTRHDIGGKLMTVAQIAARVGVGVATIKTRIRAGLRGKALLARVLRRSEWKAVDSTTCRS